MGDNVYLDYLQRQLFRNVVLTREDQRLAYPKPGEKSYATGIRRFPCFLPCRSLTEQSNKEEDHF